VSRIFGKAPPPEFSREHLEAFHLKFGQLLAAWSHIESAFAEHFIRMLGADHSVARAIFFAPRSFLGRVDLIKAVLRSQRHRDELVLYLRAMIKKSRQYNEYRNRAVHGNIMFVNGGNLHCQVVISEGGDNELDEDNAITLRRLSFAHENFQLLLECLKRPLAPSVTVERMQRYRELALELPNPPDLQPVDQSFLDKFPRPKPIRAPRPND